MKWIDLQSGMTPVRTILIILVALLTVSTTALAETKGQDRSDSKCERINKTNTKTGGSCGIVCEDLAITTATGETQASGFQYVCSRCIAPPRAVLYVVALAWDLALFTVYPSFGIVLLGTHHSKDVVDPAIGLVAPTMSVRQRRQPSALSYSDAAAHACPNAGHNGLGWDGCGWFPQLR